ncbi:NADH dehydrogenase [ubiquinone] 1 alpha subcomplex subunit 7 [Galendromus occidentalis]|uniref:NADH dehydrogenase [ubiquinone] 1 alpha subcomplex subunit 7 n=1 Tax=Galendromus occidentalis TaxID=34638 RepID=A0AAJ6VXH9_9ACAR|nr:NADH dehydrogenase [ubiquinone] 1 alpha subcomplex subunit 7 [Galendromus occidentalis]
MTKVEPRQATQVIKTFRAWLLGRKPNDQNRYVQYQAPRDPPTAKLPGGPAHKLSGNYYFNRDARRQVAPPVNLGEGQAKLPTAGVRLPE